MLPLPPQLVRVEELRDRDRSEGAEARTWRSPSASRCRTSPRSRGTARDLVLGGDVPEREERDEEGLRVRAEDAEGGGAYVFWRNPSTGQTSIWLGWNGAAFTTQVFSLTVPTTGAPVAAGDMNGGGNDDLFWYNASTGETSIWFMNGAVVSSSVRSTTVPTSWRPSSAGDYEGDGTTDLFWRNAATGETSLWLGCNGSGWTTQVRSLTVPTTLAPFASP